MHLIHFYGVLAPNAKLRKFVVPEAPDDDDGGCGHSVAYENEARSGRATKRAGNRMSQAAERRGLSTKCEEETRSGRTIRRRWIPWATLLLKVFAVDVFDCPQCHSRMQRIAWITQPRIINAILECVGRKELPP